MLKKAIWLALMVILGGCGILFPSAPPRFPQFAERSIAGPGPFELPQWSRDSRYLAFLDKSRDPILKVYDTQSDTSWDVATDLNISSLQFTWGSDNSLTYLVRRPDLSGSPEPLISDLHQVDLNGENDKIVAPHLSDAYDFVWFSDGERIAILHGELDNNSISILNVKSSTVDVLLKGQDIDLLRLTAFALSPDEKTILINGLQEKSGQYERQLVIYNLETRAILDRMTPSQIIPSGSMKYPIPVVEDTTNFGWVGGQRWFLARANTPGGNCYNYALFFFDTQDLQNSFCIPSVGGVFADPTISPDLTKISYITVVGVANYYVMIGDVTADLLNKLELTAVKKSE